MILAGLLIGGLVFLYAGAELLVKGAVAIAQRLGVGPLVIGLTIVAFGTSMPELVVSIQAAQDGAGDIAAANVIGSNIFNIALILGLAAVICPIRITAQLVKVDIPILIGVSLLCILLLADRHLSRLEGAFLFAGIIAYTVFAFYQARQKPPQTVLQEVEQMLSRQKTSQLTPFGLPAAGAIAGGLVLLVAGSKMLVSGSVRLAHLLGLSEAIIGLTIVSAGTSLPELATSIVAAVRRQPDISVGNIIGSNIFNILAILGLSSLLMPYSAPGITNVDLWVMTSITALCLPLMWSRFILSRLEGGFMLICYGIYLAYLWPK
ncbi:MAG TPA: calcium/sodium antiporter [Anaerohalosphaeraceae bacterium]|nr:calcium/sodium antiporter [Phycisphaerae bacterium]HOK96511.1 calcium/sodium antiporter [Anaerohalosphaeraceae bacterium]HOL31950.1 calcium/sodium antiporter [Anaerohalosphaeraceae bacterium]HOM76123.1 calcium/sodium antiporter [Anaerohalosphaeraceae bacterium]HPC63743.1 calcium/sodium antiporter [Anaerohalosphaeraceae bacterium]